MKMPRLMCLARPASLAGLILLAFSGCKEGQPVSYRIPKEALKASIPLRPSGHLQDGTSKLPVLPGMEEAAKAAPGLRFTLPKDWTDAGATTMRKANLRVSDAHGSAVITALVFPGDVGGHLANTNRWRSQVELDSVTAEALPEFTEDRMISGHPSLYIKLENKQKSLIGAMVSFAGQTWFFKMIGNSRTVLANENAMHTFLESVTFEVPDTPVR